MDQHQGVSVIDDIEKVIANKVNKQSKANRVCIFNYGVSSVAANAVSSYVYANSDFYLTTSSSFSVPSWIDASTDVIIMSYSGDSPEVENIYLLLKERGSRIHCITSGGKLKELADRNSDESFLLPENIDPLDAVGYEIGYLINLFESLGAVGIRDEAVSMLPRLRQYSIDIRGSKVNKLAARIVTKVPVFYALGESKAIAERWMMGVNGTLGRLAFMGEFPEFDHNEIVSWTTDAASSEFVIVMISTKSSDKMLNHIMDTAITLISEMDLDVQVVEIEGNTLENNLRGILLADAVVDVIEGWY